MIDTNKTLFADGFHEAIIGTSDDGRVIYSKVTMVEVLVDRDEMSVMDAIEYCEFNVWCAYVGTHTPIYVNDFDFDFNEINECINAQCP